MTAPVRALPDFIVAGTMKSGTSSLYKYLNQHPQIGMASRREVHFFDKYYDQGELWYRSQFPVKSGGRKRVFGEITPGYIYKPGIASKVKQLLPHVLIIVLLRNPVDRAYSHYHHHRRRWGLPITFEELITAMDGPMLDKELEKIALKILHRGNYNEQIKTWHRYFDKTQFLILESECMFSDPDAAMQKVYGFLGLKNEPLKSISPRNTGDYSERMSEESRLKLQAYYSGSNLELKKMGLAMSWIN